MSSWQHVLDESLLAEETRQQQLRSQAAVCAGRSARAIAAAVDTIQAADQVSKTAAVRGVATHRGVSPKNVWASLARAVERDPAPGGLPDDLLERLYALELAEIPALPAHLWHALAQILTGTFIDITWLHDPSELIALEVEDSIGEELDEEPAKQLAAAARTWSRIQGLAVIDSIGRRDLESLPTQEAV